MPWIRSTVQCSHFLLAINCLVTVITEGKLDILPSHFPKMLQGQTWNGHHCYWWLDDHSGCSEAWFCGMIQLFLMETWTSLNFSASRTFSLLPFPVVFLFHHRPPKLRSSELTSGQFVGLSKSSSSIRQHCAASNQQISSDPQHQRDKLSVQKLPLHRLLCCCLS